MTTQRMSLLFLLFIAIPSVYLAGPEPSEIEKFSIFDAAKMCGLGCPNKDLLRDRVKELILHSEATTERKEGKTALHVAAEHDNCEIAELLLLEWECDTLSEYSSFPNKADVNARDQEGDTPLHRAAEKGHTQFAELLVKHAAAHVDAENNHGITPLLIAAQKRDRAMIDLLIKHATNFDAHDENGMTLLHHATREGYRDIIKHLIEERADIAEDNAGNTALHYALQKGYHPIVCLLLAYGFPIIQSREQTAFYLSMLLPAQNRPILLVTNKREELRKLLYTTNNSILPDIVIELIIDHTATPQLD